MVIAAFYVIGSDVRAETVGEPIAEPYEQASAIEHLDRRLTISNDGATDPHVLVNDNLTYLLWVDGNEGSQRPMWAFLAIRTQLQECLGLASTTTGNGAR